MPKPHSRRRLFGIIGIASASSAFGALFPEIARAAGPRSLGTQGETPWMLTDIVEEHPASTQELDELRPFVRRQAIPLEEKYGRNEDSRISMVVSTNRIGNRVVRSGAAVGASASFFYAFEISANNSLLRSNLQVWQHNAKEESSELLRDGSGANSLQPVSALRDTTAAINYCPPGTYVQLRCARIRSWDCIYTSCGTYSWPCSWAIGNVPAAVACLMVTCAWGIQTCCTSWTKYCSPA